MLNGHGDDIYNQSCEIVSNFSSNIYYRHDLQALRNYLCDCIGKIHSYPEPDAASIGKLLAGIYRVDSSNICMTNGATEAIYLIAQAFACRKTAIIIPTFGEYEDACTIHRHIIRFYRSPENMDSGTQLVWICNPNNPTGTVYDKEYLKKLVVKYPDTVFVFDQSYKDFIIEECWEIKEACRYKNVILLHSMTKSGCIPGLRLGYFSAPADIMAYVSKYRMPWSVNRLAIESGKFLLENPVNDISLEDYLTETKRFRDKLAEIEGIMVFPTKTHFFLCRLQNGKACELKRYLVNNHGILIRDASNFNGLDERYFRLATQSPEENENLINAVKTWVLSNSAY